jgi:RNA polymerase sigma factor (sigma-70 family)
VNRASSLISAPDPGVPTPEEVEQAYLLHAADVRRHATRAAQGDRQRAEEATQDAFMAAWRDWTRFRLLPPELQLNWLCRRARWLVIDSWRREAGPELPSDDIPDQPAPEIIEDLALSAVTLDRFWKIISAMPQRARRAAYLRWHEDWTMDSIAARLGIDRATVARDLHAVRALAQEQLADDRNEP